MSSTSSKTNLLGMSKRDLEQLFAARGEKSFRARQVLQWIYQKGVTDFDDMTDLPVSYLYGIFAVEDKAFQRISAQDQAIVRKVFADVYAGFENANLKDDREALAALVESGVDVVKPDPELAPKWKTDAAALRIRLAREGLYSLEMLEKVDGLQSH